MEKQLEFDFVKELRPRDETCAKCKYVDGHNSICSLSSEEVSGDGWCHFHEYNSDIAMREIENENEKFFSELMDAYSVAEKDRVAIYQACKWF